SIGVDTPRGKGHSSDWIQNSAASKGECRNVIREKIPDVNEAAARLDRRALEDVDVEGAALGADGAGGSQAAGAGIERVSGDVVGTLVGDVNIAALGIDFDVGRLGADVKVDP